MPKPKPAKELPKTYDPAAYEDRIYAAWETSGAFKPASDGRTKGAKEKRPYSIVMPPPNVTDRLHSGHAVMIALEDALIRYHRMRGFDTLYLPGTDHAAIATAAQIDKQLAKEGKTRHDIGRKEFRKRATEFGLANKRTIEEQVRAMGASADWSRNAFTMDAPRRAAVQEAFKRLYKKGLIYRGSYMVNWCPACRTVLADDEVEHREQEGVLYHLDYGPFTVATTRPETMVGDTAVAVHPKDKRYAALVGQTVEVTMISGIRKLRVIADDAVDPEFGTGAVKVTPFHDKTDYEIGKRHGLEAPEVIGEDGKMTEAAGAQLAGLDRFAARKKVVSWLKRKKLLKQEALHKHSVGRCYRSDDVIEPRISEQWFVKVSEIRKQAIRFAEDGDLKFVPQRFEKTYRQWLENLHDWCISRQIWFGHPVPAFVNATGDISLTKKPGFKPSEDTLDTWFSSALWPFSTMGWPKRTADFTRFFPNDVLETGYDIIFFWITRMVLMTVALEVKDEKSGQLKPPFHTAYLHGLVRDGRGRKFSKSLGNGVDPLKMIAKYGADALRWMLTTSASPGNDMKFDEDRLVKSRNFANKLWNISRFVIEQTDGAPEGGKLASRLDAGTLTSLDRGILHKLLRTARTVEAALHDPAAYDKPGKVPAESRTKPLAKPYDLGFAGNALYEFIWSDFADWYLEIAKVQLANPQTAGNTAAILRFTLETILGLLHPFMPFVTEVVWREGLGKQEPLITSSWPELHEDLDQPEDGARFDRIRELVEAIRRIRATHKTPAKSFVQAYIVTDEPAWVLEASDAINKLARLSMLRIGQHPPKDKVASVAVGDTTVVVPLAGLASDVATGRLQQEIEQAKMDIERLKGRLGNEDYVEHAPQHIVAETKARLAEAEAALAKLEAQRG